MNAKNNYNVNADVNYSINRMIMYEVGLDALNVDGSIIDQDTGSIIAMKDIKLIHQDFLINNKYNEMHFDPDGNWKQMSFIFGYFLKKIYDENNIDVGVYTQSGKNNQYYIECVLSNGLKLKSNLYNRDSLAYLDMMMRLNGENNVDLSNYDVKRG